MSMRYLLPIAFAFVTSVAHASLDTARQAYERKDYAEALSEYRVHATRGNTEAMAILSIMYLNGEGVQRDVPKAIEYANKIIQKGDNAGYNLLATMYLSPQAGVLDKEKGLAFLRAGVEKGEENAMVRYARMLLQGGEVPQDIALAYQYFEKASNRYQSITAAQFLGLMHEAGIGRPVDEGKALTWYESIQKVTVHPVPVHVASIYVRQAAMKLRRGHGPHDLADAVALLEEAAKSGNGEAMHRLGKLYETGRGVAQDYLAAAVLYERGADAGDAGAMYSGGLLFERGLGVKQDSAEALNWFAQAGGKGHSVASRRLAKAWDEGLIVKVNHVSAANLYCRAVFSEAAAIAHPELRIHYLETPAAQPVAEQLAILDQCPSEQPQARVSAARAILGRQLTPAIQAEAERLSKAMKASNNISRALLAKS